jgi:CheY-like chemotaxis protein
MNYAILIWIIYDMQIAGIVVLIGLSIILFEIIPEESVWSIPVRQGDEHMIAVPASGGFFLLLGQQEAYKTLIKEQQRFWKRIMIVDDDADITMTFRTAIEDSNNDVVVNKRIEVYTSNDPIVALSEFKPNFYDLLLVDINMPRMNGFALCEKLLVIDINVKVCFMSSGEINRQALRAIYPSLSVGCFIRKPRRIHVLADIKDCI